MAGTKVSFVFLQGANGWTESHYLTTASSDFATELASAQALAPKRMILSGKDTFMTFIRLSDIDKPRRFRLEPLTPNLQGPGSTPSDSATQCVLVKLRDAGFNNTGQLFLHAPWDELIDNGGQINYSSVWYTSNFSAFITALRTGGWGFRGRDLTLQKKGIILTATGNVGGTVHITTDRDIFPGPFPPLSPTTSFVSGAQGAALINGQTLWVPTDARTADSFRRLPIFPYVANSGRITVNTKPIIQVNTGIAERAVERKVGRPLYQSAGRKRARKVA